MKPWTSFAVRLVTFVPKYCGGGISSAVQGSCLPRAVLERARRLPTSSIGDRAILRDWMDCYGPHACDETIPDVFTNLVRKLEETE